MPAQPGGFRAKLFDFGVAKLLGDKTKQVGHKTIDGPVVGTPFYMSPEQALCQDVGAAGRHLRHGRRDVRNGDGRGSLSLPSSS